MKEYELFVRMLSRDFLSPNQHVMEEPKQAGAHTCIIVETGVEHYMVYRYDMDKRNFLPFFNKGFDDEKKGVVIDNPTPSGLLKFCDYIILAAICEKLYVILVEMKSGANAGARLQLAASETFFDYVKASAERIKTLCGYDDFDTRNIILRKVLLKPAPKKRPTTNIGKKRNTQIDWGADPIELWQQVFPLRKVCECRQK